MPGQPGNGRIFVSYRREDSAYPTGWLTDRLAEHYGSQQVFTDVDTIEIGDDFVKRIRDAVASCDVLLAVIGPKWLTITDEDGRRRLDDPEDYVRIEIEAALRRNVLVIPILVDDAAVPRVADLPGGRDLGGADPDPTSLASLPHREALALNPAQFDWAVNRLLTKLDQVLGERSAGHVQPRPRKPADDPVPHERPQDAGPEGARRWLVAACLVVAVAVLALATSTVLPDVYTARNLQPRNDLWMGLVWLAPAVPALATAWLVLARSRSGLGAMLGCAVAAAWMVALSWALFDVRQATHGGVHALVLALMLAAVVALAAMPSARQRVRPNPVGLALFAVVLAVLGSLLRNQATGIGNALAGADVDWGLHPEQAPFWAGTVLPLAACLVAAAVHGNAVQARSLRVYVGVVVVYSLVIRAGSVAYALSIDEADAGVYLGACAWGLGSLLLWWAVSVSQPRARRGTAPDVAAEMTH